MLIIFAVLALLALLIICVTIYSIKENELEAQKPQNKCNHNMTNLLVKYDRWKHEPDTAVYLSTCTKCGYQTKHYF